MRAAVYHGPGDVRVEELTHPVVGPRDVLLKVLACGVCGSDLASFADGHYVEPGQVMGHEIAARVWEIGAELTGLLPGQSVAVRPMRSCDSCAYCDAGDTHLCGGTAGRSLGYGPRGGFAEFLHLTDVVVGSDLIPVPDDIDPLDLMWAEPLAVAVHAVSRALSDTDASWLVVGAGAVGLAVVAAASSLGVGAITVVEPRADRREAARSLGARALEPRTLPEDARFAVLIDASGSSRAVQDVLPTLLPGGRCVLVGLGSGPVPWPLASKQLLGAFAYRDDDFRQAVELIVRGQVRLGRYVTDKFALDLVEQALIAPGPQAATVKAALVFKTSNSENPRGNDDQR
jgi:threonine dehydrogenase-like Zn-dependent dehydrogenase